MVEAQKTSEQSFNDQLVTAEGDVELAAEFIATGIREGKLDAAIAVPALLEYVGAASFCRSGIKSSLSEALRNGSSSAVRRGALRAVKCLSEEGGKAVEPTLMDLFDDVLACFEYKETIDETTSTAETMMEKMNSHATRRWWSTSCCL